MIRREGHQEKWAKIPESVITNELLPGIDPRKQATAFRLYCYLDLRQGDRGWSVRGIRSVGWALGLQPRTVASAAKNLADAGLIELTLTSPTATSAVMSVVHNPARSGRTNRAVSLGVAPKRYRHVTLPAPSIDGVRGPPALARTAHTEASTPDARNATGSRSTRSEWFDSETRDALFAIASDESRCGDCLGVINARGHTAEPVECCTCPFVSEVG